MSDFPEELLTERLGFPHYFLAKPSDTPDWHTNHTLLIKGNYLVV